MVMGARKVILLTIFVVLLGTSREAWAQKISIHMNNATLEEVLKKIKKKTKYDMMYQMKDVKEIGTYTELIQLHREVKVDVEFEVVSE